MRIRTMTRTETATFEATYVGYPFAPLVRLAIALGAWLRKLESAASHSQHGAVGKPA